MDPERWKEIERLCQNALEMEPGRREEYLKSACAGDESLRKEVEALLANLTEAEGFMKDPAIDVAAKALAKEQENALARDLIGRTIAHYRIVEKIGQGGMGEVFLAEDTSLHRNVALKFLSPEMQQDPVAHKRFLREAHSAAALAQPYICGIYEVSEFEGKDFIVMEYVDGQTLRDRLTKGPLPLKEAIQTASEVAEALEEAHEKRIIHRDLKPANIMLTGKGHSKVMDFGLAKQLIPPGGIESREGSVTELTRSGTTPGTLAYMSPEQLRGETIDARSDMFSFGVVLYEMLAGSHPFKRDTGMDTASAILKDAPRPLGEVRADTPGLLQHIVRKMLAKDARDRYSSIHEVQTDLKELVEESDRPTPKKRRRLKPLYWIAATALAVVSAGIWVFFRFYPREAALPPPRIVLVTTTAGEKGNPSLSPDGNWIAFQWDGETRDNLDIYVKELDGRGFNRLTTDPAEDCCPAWSPDGRQVAFLRRSVDRWILNLISPLGGGERKLTEIGRGPLSWSPDGKKIAFRYSKSPEWKVNIWSLTVDTLEKTRLTTSPDDSPDFQPAYSPDGRSLAFVRAHSLTGTALYVMSLPHGDPKLVTDYNSPWTISWTADSREIVFASLPEAAEMALWRIPVDGGEPRRVPARGERISSPTVSRNRLAYVSNAGNMDIWRMELTGKGAVKPASRPLLSWPSDEIHPVVSPDGRRIAFRSNSSGDSEIWVCNSDGTKPVRVTDMKAKSVGSPSWSPDGKLIAFDSNRIGNLDIYVVSAEGGPIRRITTDPADEGAAQWSRDGRWIYFASDRSGSWQIWKMPSEGGKAIQIPKSGGLVARESADGYLYYSSYSPQKPGMWRVPVSGGSETLVTDETPMRDAVGGFYWDLTDRGIYAIDWHAKPVATVCFYDFATRRVASLAPIHGDPGFSVYEGLSVSPDGKWLVYDGGIFTSDIMLIDNFR